MAISGQQNINIGQPNSPANSDSLYTAFNTIQDNFTQLFQACSPITSLVAGQGVQISNTLPNSYAITNTGVISLVAGRNVTITTLAGTPGSNGTLIINSTGTGGNGGGTVDSVGITSNTLNVTNSPITTNGNIDVELLTVPGVAGSYRSANITVDSYGRITSVANGASSGTVTSIALSAGNGISVGGSPITTSGTITVTNTGVTSIVAGTGITINQSNGAVTINSTGGNGGGGTVTRVAVNSNTLVVSGSPIVSSGTIEVDLPANLTTNVLTANVSNVASMIGNQLQINAANSNVGVTVTTAGATANSYGFVSKKSRGTIAAPTIALTGDTLLNVEAQAYTQFTKYQSGGSFQVFSNGTATTGSSYVPTIVSINSTSNTAIEYNMTLDDRGNLILPGRVSRHIYSNVTNPSTDITSRARGTDSGNILTIQNGDTIARDLTYGYTGNGTTTIDDTTGFSFSGGTEFVVASLPTANGQFIPTNYIIKTVNTSNTVINSTFTSTGNLNIVGTYIGSKLQINTSDSNSGATVSTASNNANLYGYVAQKSRGTTSAPLPTQVGDILLNVQGQGYTSFNTYRPAGYLKVASNGVPTTANSFMPSIVSLNSTSNTGLDFTLSLDDRGNVIVPGRISRHMYSNVTSPATDIVSRARGTDAGNVAIIQVGDAIQNSIYYGYTGNGTVTVNGITGWAYAGGTDAVMVGSPTAGGNVPSSFSIKTVANNGSLLTSTFDNNGDLTIPGEFIGNVFAGNRFAGNTLSVTGNANVGGLETTLTATANTTATVQATIPIIINGVAYKIMLSQ
jgi:filamentous hemagglutinin